MIIGKKMFVILAWLQLAISIVMGVLVICAYMSFRAPMHQLMQSIQTTMLTGSSLLEASRETIEARQVYLDETAKLLVKLRSTLMVLSGVVKNQQVMVPQYTESLRSASSIAGSMSGVLHHTANDLMNVRFPSGIKIGFPPRPKMHYPFKGLAATLEKNSVDFKNIGNRISVITDTIASDGQNVGTSMVALANQATKMVDETFLTLATLKQGLPKGLKDLQLVSDSLKSFSAKVHFLSYMGIVLLVFGLLISAWCFVHSIGALMVLRSQAFEKPATEIIAAVDLST